MTLRTITSQTYPIIRNWVETASLHTLQHDSVKLAYTQAGSGRPLLVFLHGWAGDHTTFTPQFKHFGVWAREEKGARSRHHRIQVTV